MSYYLRVEDADGQLMMGTEIDHDRVDQRLDYVIDTMGLQAGEKLKLYDLGNPTRTVTVEALDGDNSSERTDGAEPGNATNGPVQSDE